MIRSATPADVQAVYELVLELAEYERLTHLVEGTAEDLRRSVFVNHDCSLDITEVDGRIVGYMLYFPNFSTFRMRPGTYLEDIYVTPSHRGRGYGKAMLLHLIAKAREEGRGRVEWSVLDWNLPSIEFYRSMGAEVMPEWHLCRITL